MDHNRKSNGSTLGLEHPTLGGGLNSASQLLFRAGYAAQGVIYLLIGAFAFAVAIGVGGKITDPRGVLATIGKQPFGKFALLILGIGLLGYVLWRFSQAFLNIEKKPVDTKNVLKRIGNGISGAIYLGLAIIAFRGFQANGNTASESSTHAGEIMSFDGGHYLMMAIGLTLIIFGVTQIYRGIKEKFMEDFDQRSMNTDERKAVRLSGKIGLPARGVTFGIVGYFFMKAGLQYDPSKAKSSKGALQFVLEQPFGYVLLGLIASGFIAFAVHCFLAARHQHFARL